MEGRERERGDERRGQSSLKDVAAVNKQLHSTRLTQRTLLTEENTGRQGNVMNDAIRM